MEGGWDVLLNLLITLGAASFFGIVTARLKLGPIVGFLIGGAVVGPGGLGLIDEFDEVMAVSELGVILLLFAIGLEFSWSRLKKLGSVGIRAGLLQIIVTLGFGAGIAMAWGLSWQVSVILGSILAMSSTAVVLRVLKDSHNFDSAHGRPTVAVLLVQDLALVPLLFVVTALSTRGTLEIDFAALSGNIITVIVVIGAVFFGATKLMPRLLGHRIVSENREIPIVLAVISCLAAAYAAHEIHLSPTIGAFLAGVLLAGTPFADQIRADVGPLRAVFVTLFLASVGMLADVRWVANHIGPTLIATLLVLVGKTLIVFGILRLLRQSIIVSMATGICLSQIGEFSFVLATIARNGQILDGTLFQLVVAASVLSLFLTPILAPRAAILARRIVKPIFPKRFLARDERRAPKSDHLRDHIVLIGYGDAGAAAAEVFIDAGRKVYAIDISPPRVAQANASGVIAKVGDATLTVMLEEAHLEHAVSVVITIPDQDAAQIIIRQVRSFSETLPIISRVRYQRYNDELLMAGASAIVDEDVAIGYLLASRALVMIGGQPVVQET